MAPNWQQRARVRGKTPLAPGRRPRPERGGALVEVELEPVGLGVEPVDEVAEQPGGTGAQDAEPEALDIDGPGVVADRVDDGVAPGDDEEGGRVGRDVTRVHAGLQQERLSQVRGSRSCTLSVSHDGR